MERLKMGSSHLQPLRRPNGRLQACDTCRRRKLACDHTRPICARCRKQNRRCVYTVSTDGSASHPNMAGRASVLSTPSASQSLVRPDSSVGCGTSPSALTGVSNSTTRGPTSATVTRSGYLGATSYSAVYEDSLSLLGAAAELKESSCNVQAKEEASCMTPTVRDLALKVLNRIPDYGEDPDEFRTDCGVWNEWMHRIAWLIRQSLYKTFGETLKGRDPKRLEDMARVICQNTARPFLEDVSDPNEWLSQLLGPNLRWESLGLLFDYWNLDPSLKFTARRPDKVQLKATLEVTSLCIRLARELSDGNMFLVALHYRRANLESMVVGDARMSVWRYHAESVSLMTFLGMHAEPHDASYRPTLASELRRRLASAVFCIDKVVVSFTGRPPLLSRIYFSTPLPLDLDVDFSIWANEATLNQALKTLDERGWNIDGHIYSATFVRARAMFMRNRDEIFQVALGSGSPVSIEYILGLKAKHDQMVSELPKALFYTDGELQAGSDTVNTSYLRLLTSLDCLQNVFFLERLLQQRAYDDQGGLLATSYELVTLTVSLWTHMDLFTRLRKDFEWLVMGYGAPAGGILCLELLRPTFQGSHPKHPEITRSSIIQTLSLLVGFLSWVDGSAPNADLCANTKTIIQRVLDKTLNAAPVGDTVPAPLDWDFSTQVDFNFDLLDTFDWMRSEA